MGRFGSSAAVSLGAQRGAISVVRKWPRRRDRFLAHNLYEKMGGCELAYPEKLRGILGNLVIGKLRNLPSVVSPVAFDGAAIWTRLV